MNLLDGALSHETLAGKAIRLPLRLLPAGAVVPILSGPASGLKWIIGSGPNSCWLGINEREKRKRIATLLEPGAVFYDVGANVGSYTMLASRAVGAAGRVIAFEPVPENLRLLRQHIEINQLANVEVVPAVARGSTGAVQFQTMPDRLRGRVALDGDFRADAIVIDDLVRSGLIPPPDCIKIDVEGDELEVLRGASATIASVRPSIFVAVHSEALHRDTTNYLEQLGYEVSAVGERWELFADPSRRE